MSALGQKQTFGEGKKSCPLYPQKRTCAVQRDVRFVPKADITLRLFDQTFVRADHNAGLGR